MIRTGNAESEGRERRGWFVGTFMPEDDLRHRRAVEVKWASHAAGDGRAEWAGPAEGWTLSILVRGHFVVQFREKEIRLTKEADYVLWGPGVDHTWRCEADCTIVTVRWAERAK